MSGLAFPGDFAAWQKWANPSGILASLRRLKRGVRKTEATGIPTALVWGDPRAPIAVVLDSLTPTSLPALERPLTHLDRDRVRIVLPLGKYVPGHEDKPCSQMPVAQAFSGSQVIVAAGRSLQLGAAGLEYATKEGVPFVLVQHGLLTPYAPPLPTGVHLMAWTEADADFWRSGRTDVTTEVVGSQLLWEASSAPAPSTPETSGVVPLTYLGQLHGAELPRRDMARSAGAFCRATGATYRPHPSEKDKLSRAQHAIWRRQGMKIDEGSTPLALLNTPVVSAFSTGVLEAAAKGIPAWVYFDNPPQWLSEFWQRYNMSPFGGPATPAPVVPEREPAAVLAQRITEMLEG